MPSIISNGRYREATAERMSILLLLPLQHLTKISSVYVQDLYAIFRSIYEYIKCHRYAHDVQSKHLSSFYQLSIMLLIFLFSNHKNTNLYRGIRSKMHNAEFKIICSH